MLQSKALRIAFLTTLISVLPAASCDRPASTPLPPARDVEAVTEAKPVPTLDILTSAKANADHHNAVESWGERIHAAGVRLCEWLNDAGKKAGADYKCEQPPSD